MEKGIGLNMVIAALVLFGIAVVTFVLDLYVKKMNGMDDENENQDNLMLITEQQ